MFKPSTCPENRDRYTLHFAGRWASAQMPAHYARTEIAPKGAVARFHREDWVNLQAPED